MANKGFEISTYSISMGDRLSFGGGQYQFRRVISCNSKDGQRLIIYFQAEGEQLYPPFTDLDIGLGRIFLPVSEFSAFVDVLRNEKPLYGYISDQKPEWNTLRTLQEPVGEAE